MKSNLKQWAKAATVRAAKTAAQSAIGVIGASAVLSDVDFAVVGSAAALAAIVSYLTSIAGIPEVDGGQSLATIENRDRLDAMPSETVTDLEIPDQAPEADMGVE